MFDEITTLRTAQVGTILVLASRISHCYCHSFFIFYNTVCIIMLLKNFAWFCDIFFLYFVIFIVISYVITVDHSNIVLPNSFFPSLYETVVTVMLFISSPSCLAESVQWISCFVSLYSHILFFPTVTLIFCPLHNLQCSSDQPSLASTA
jgi:hypothetical protein